MKRIMIMAFAAALLSACNNETENTTSESDTMSLETTAPMEDNSTTGSYAPAEGDVTYRENRVQVWRGGAWQESNEDVRMDNGVVVYRDGRAMRDGREIELEDGVVVDRSGNVFDRTGRAMENAWESTKEGVKKAGSAVGDAAEKVGEKAKNAVDNDPEH